MTTTEKTEKAVVSVLQQLEKAIVKHHPIRGPHEGYAVILEELDEVWHEVKRNDLERAKAEVLHVAAVALRFYIDL